jgi:hypothetical protein
MVHKTNLHPFSFLDKRMGVSHIQSFRELQEAGAKKKRKKTLSLFMNYQLVLTNSLMINQGKGGCNNTTTTTTTTTTFVHYSCGGDYPS